MQTAIIEMYRKCLVLNLVAIDTKMNYIMRFCIETLFFVQPFDRSHAICMAHSLAKCAAVCALVVFSFVCFRLNSKVIIIWE